MSTPKGIKRHVTTAIKAANREMAGHASSGGHFARGTASEGFAGGYCQALSDILLLLNGVMPNTRGYWDECKPSKPRNP